MKNTLKFLTLLLSLALVGCQEKGGLDDDHNKPQGSVVNNYTIFYTSTDGEIVTPHSLEAIDATLVSNTYEDGKGRMVFDKDITTIGRNAFLGCRTLASVTLPESITTLAACCFPYCTNLSSFDGKFASKDGLSLIAGNVLIAFAPASGVTEYTIPSNITTIAMAAFVESKSLQQVTIPNSVVSISPQAFAYCSSLSSVTIPSSVTRIGESAFYDCSSLSSVYCRPTTPPSVMRINESDPFLAFYNNSAGRKIYVPDSSKERYKEADGWKEYAESIVGHNF